MKKLSKQDQEILRISKEWNYTPFECKEHGLFATIDGNNKCPYCKKECPTYNQEDHESSNNIK
ncbi:MAG: hypothetical protein LKI39_02615 [Bacteroides sp.]|jgi:hypothetical protein|nr:hypothetical protein [Bacteroides sp.]